MKDNLFREWPSYLGLSIIKSRKNSINNKGRKKMGLLVYSLENIPKSKNRDYFIYLLEYELKVLAFLILKMKFFLGIK